MKYGDSDANNTDYVDYGEIVEVQFKIKNGRTVHNPIQPDQLDPSQEDGESYNSEKNSDCDGGHYGNEDDYYSDKMEDEDDDISAFNQCHEQLENAIA